MSQIVPQRVGYTGAAPAFQAAAGGGDTLTNDGRSLLHYKNASGGSITVTIVASGKCEEGFLHDIQIAVPAGGERVLGPFQMQRYGASTSITYSGVTSLTVASYDLAS